MRPKTNLFAVKFATGNNWKQMKLFPVANITVCRVKFATGIIVS